LIIAKYLFSAFGYFTTKRTPAEVFSQPKSNGAPIEHQIVPIFLAVISTFSTRMALSAETVTIALTVKPFQYTPLVIARSAMAPSPAP
jgi:hypothetical protein